MTTQLIYTTVFFSLTKETKDQEQKAYCIRKEKKHPSAGNIIQVLKKNEVWLIKSTGDTTSNNHVLSLVWQYLAEAEEMKLQSPVYYNI